MFQVGTATGGIRDDGIEGGRIKEVDHSPRHFGRPLGIPVVRMERSAAGLDRGSDHLATVGQQNVRGVPVDVGEDKILDTSGEKAHPVPGLFMGNLHRSDELVGELRPDSRSHPLQVAPILGQPPGQTQPTKIGRAHV